MGQRGEGATVILAIDPGLANLGWAIVRPKTGRVVDLGVICTSPNDDLGKDTDRLSRTRHLARELKGLIRRYQVEVITGEAISRPPGKSNVAASASAHLSWGVLVTLAEVLELELCEVPAKQWQHAIMPGVAKIDYDALADAISKFLRYDGKRPVDTLEVSNRLALLPRSKREHALDAVGVGIYTALRDARRIEARA